MFIGDRLGVMYSGAKKKHHARPRPDQRPGPPQPELTDEQLEKASGGFQTRDETPPELTDEQLEKSAGGIGIGGFGGDGGAAGSVD